MLISNTECVVKTVCGSTHPVGSHSEQVLVLFSIYELENQLITKNGIWRVSWLNGSWKYRG